MCKGVNECVETIVTNEVIPSNNNLCKCGKKYETKAGLWKHKKTCKTSEDKLSDVIKEAVENAKKEFQKTITEALLQIEKYQTININEYNMNIFLSEKCPNGQNICEFFQSIDAGDIIEKDLQNFQKVGFVDTYTDILIRYMNKFPIQERPLHFIENVHNSIYIKYRNRWVEENKNSHTPILDEALEQLDKDIYKIVLRMRDSRYRDNAISTLDSIKSNDLQDSKHNLLEKICISSNKMKELLNP
jgi:hypothetical protein